MIKIPFLLLLLSCIACTNNATTGSNETPAEAAGSNTVHATADDTIVTGAKPIIVSGCYQMILKQDTANLRLKVTDTIVTGKLNYHFYQKDWNDGSIKGVLRDNMIYADYSFQSEGMTSVREVVFRIDDSVLLQGFGELTDKGGKIVFRDKASLQFNTSNPFIKEACR